MKKLFLLYLLAFVFSFTSGFYPVDANAEDVEYRLLTYLVRVDFISVPDVDKHAIGIFERRGVAIFKNGETAAYHSRGTWDFIDGNGTFQGYTTLTYKDGSTTISKYSGNQTQETGKLATMKGNGEYIKGTGKYEGIQVISQKIEKGRQVGMADSFCVGLIAAGKAVQKGKDLIGGNLVDFELTEILAESINDGLIRSNGIFFSSVPCDNRSRL